MNRLEIKAWLEFANMMSERGKEMSREIVTILRKTQVVDLIEWVAKARSTDPLRSFMDGILIEDTTNGHVVVSTDGGRMHYAEIPEGTIPVGNYHYSVTKTDIVLMPADGQFPNWQSVLPKNLIERTKYIAQLWKKNEFKVISEQVCTLLRVIKANVNLQFIFDLAFGKVSIEYTVSMLKTEKGAKSGSTQIDYNRALAFDAIDRHAVVMPLQRDED